MDGLVKSVDGFVKEKESLSVEGRNRSIIFLSVE